MSLPPPSLVASLTQNIRARPILWDSYQRANVINEQELRLIKAVDKVSKEKRVSIIEGDINGYVKLIIGDGNGEKGLLERSAKRVEFVQYLLALAAELCEEVPSYVNAIISHPDPYSHLLTLLSHSDDSVPIISSNLLTTLLSAALATTNPNQNTKNALPTLFKYLATTSASQESNLQDLAVQSYVHLLRNSYARNTFWDMGDETMKGLVNVIETAAAGSKGKGTTDVGLSSSASSMLSGTTAVSGNLKQGGVGLQLLYHCLVVVWQLSFEEAVAEELDEKYDLILPIVHLLRSALKEKILRVSLAIIANLVTKAPSTNLPPLLLARLLPLLSTLKARKFADPDLTSDLDTCLSTLESFQTTQTNFDEYATEIRSGHLSWTPPHRNDDFWKKNARRIMEESNGELVKSLARVLQESQEKTVLAVAAHDVGVLVKEVPEKRRVWDGLRVKARVMELMGDSDPEVRYESLKAVQEFLRYAFGG